MLIGLVILPDEALEEINLNLGLDILIILDGG
jgi:hypothetical protein